MSWYGNESLGKIAIRALVAFAVIGILAWINWPRVGIDGVVAACVIVILLSGRSVYLHAQQKGPSQ